MTYTESLKSGHIAVWDPSKCAMTFTECVSITGSQYSAYNLMFQSDIYTVNAINQMIDSARDL